MRQVQMPQSSLFLLRFSCFSFIDFFQISASLWLASRALGKVDFDIFFASGLIALIGSAVFGGPFPKCFLLSNF